MRWSWSNPSWESAKPPDTCRRTKQKSKKLQSRQRDPRGARLHGGGGLQGFQHPRADRHVVHARQLERLCGQSTGRDGRNFKVSKSDRAPSVSSEHGVISSGRSARHLPCRACAGAHYPQPTSPTFGSPTVRPSIFTPVFGSVFRVFRTLVGAHAGGHDLGLLVIFLDVVVDALHLRSTRERQLRMSGSISPCLLLLSAPPLHVLRFNPISNRRAHCCSRPSAFHSPGNI